MKKLLSGPWGTAEPACHVAGSVKKSPVVKIAIRFPPCGMKENLMISLLID